MRAWSADQPAAQARRPALHARGVRSRDRTRCATRSATTRSTSRCVSRAEEDHVARRTLGAGEGHRARRAAHRERQVAGDWNILARRRVGAGQAAELLDGGAWRRFTRAARRARGAHPGRRTRRPTPIDARRRLSATLTMLVRNAFDVAIEDIDPDRPTIRWLTGATRSAGTVPTRSTRPSRSATTRSTASRGRRGNVHFLGLQVTAGIRTLANAHADEWDARRRRPLRARLGGPSARGNWIPLDARRALDLGCASSSTTGSASCRRRCGSTASTTAPRGAAERAARSGLLRAAARRGRDQRRSQRRALARHRARAARALPATRFPTRGVRRHRDGRAEAPGGRHLLLPRRAATRRC